MHAVVAQSTFPSQNVQNTTGSDHFWKLRGRKSARRCGAKHISKSKGEKTEELVALWYVRAKRARFVAVSKTMAGVGHMQRIWQDAFRVAGAVQETCSSELLGGQGADFLRGVAFWSIRSSALGK